MLGFLLFGDQTFGIQPKLPKRRRIDEPTHESSNKNIMFISKYTYISSDTSQSMKYYFLL